MSAAPGDGAAPGGGVPYTSGREHLEDELRRVSHLVRAQTVRWRALIADTKPPEHWGMLRVTPAEVDAFLSDIGHRPGALPPALRAQLAGHRQAAADARRTIGERLAATPDDVPLPLARLAGRFALDPAAQDVLLLSLLPELDSRYRRLYGYLQDDASRDLPTAELLLEMVEADEPAAGRTLLAPDGALLRNHLLRVEAEATGRSGLARREVRADDRVVAHLLADDAPDERVADAVVTGTPVAWDRLVTTEQHRVRLRGLAGWCRARLDDGAVVLLDGPPGSGRRTTAQAVCTAIDVPLLVADTARLLRSAADWGLAVDLVFREAAMRDAALLWWGTEPLFERGEPRPEWHRLLATAAGSPGLTFLTGHVGEQPGGSAAFLRLPLPLPTFEVREELWRSHLPAAAAFARPAPDREALAAGLASAFQLTPGHIVDAVAAARSIATARDPAEPLLTVDDVFAGCRRQSGRRLVSLARRVEPRPDLTLDQLVLNPTSRRQLEELRDRIALRARVQAELGLDGPTHGKGLIVLFTGSSGTGKTMAAELLAQDQRVDLYKVDLAEVVSKYIGETEKNLRRVFQEAEDTNAVVFFDEADALFGKRGEVQQARDRWANIEVNFLLQRVEEYSGVVVLATNLRQNIDEAFLRRIHVVVEFPFPDASERLRIWMNLLPDRIAHPGENEVAELADRFLLPGGSIRNVVVDACFRALAAGEHPPRMTMRQLAAATAREYQKLGKPVTGAEFGQQLYAWAGEDILLGPSAGRT